jgi:hypothetical protein
MTPSKEASRSGHRRRCAARVRSPHFRVPSTRPTSLSSRRELCRFRAARERPELSPLDLAIAPNGNIVVSSEYPFGASDAVATVREYDSADGHLFADRAVFASVPMTISIAQFREASTSIACTIPMHTASRRSCPSRACSPLRGRLLQYDPPINSRRGRSGWMTATAHGCTACLVWAFPPVYGRKATQERR